jgi:hypothetical protein
VTLQVLEPPYQQAYPQGPRRPSVGAVLIADLADGIPALAQAVVRAREAPWCPLVSVLMDRAVPAATLTAFEPVMGTWAALYPNDFSHQTLRDRALAAVRRRPIPQATTVALWVESRLGVPGCASVLAACFGEGVDALRPPRTLTRRVRALGPFEVRDWRGLARLARVLASRVARAAQSLEAGALEAGVDPRTLRRWLRLATELSWAEAGTRAGWEWILESALRRYGYVEHRELRRVSGGFARLVPAPRWPER